MSFRLGYSFLFWLAVFLSIALLLPAAAMAEDDAIEFDLFRLDSCLMVSLNLTPFLDAKRVEMLQEGVDQVFDYHLILKRPRKIWGAEKIAAISGYYKCSFRIVTGSYVLTSFDSTDTKEKVLTSLDELKRQLTDSIVVKHLNLAKLDEKQRYFIDISLTRISLNSFNLMGEQDSRNQPGSPIKYLFVSFLELTGYGRQEFQTESRRFSVSEILPR